MGLPFRINLRLFDHRAGHVTVAFVQAQFHGFSARAEDNDTQVDDFLGLGQPEIEHLLVHVVETACRLCDALRREFLGAEGHADVG